MPRALPLILVVLVSACVAPVAPLSPLPAATPNRLDAELAARNFTSVVVAVEPVAEAECRARAPRLDCDFRIVVDSRPGQPPNAFQTRDETGRPVIGFTLALIAEARNRDELAFILGHEAGHHVAGHLARTQQSALAGAIIFGTLASLSGAVAGDVEAAQNLGANVGARTYSKDFELEADRLGTVIAYRAGFDPARGSEFFTRIPDPGNRFLGSHPPNAARRSAVLDTLARLR